MFNFLLKQTDNFICQNIKTIFEDLETKYEVKDKKINLIRELKNLELNPFVCPGYESSSFEKKIKLKLKSILGIFFVLIPLIAMLTVSYMLSIPYGYSFLMTLAIAIFAAFRTDKVATKFSNFRHSNCSFQ